MVGSEIKGTAILKLGDVFKTTSGGTPRRKVSSYYDGNIPWVKSGELESNVIYGTEEKISEEAINNSSAKIFPKGTLLIALYGATIGKLARLGIDAATNQAVCGIFENEEHDLQYLYWYLHFKRRDLIKAGIGGAQPNISQTILKNLEVPLPKKGIQQQIVSKIEEFFSKLDKSIEQLKTAQQQLKVYRQGVLKWAFEGRLTNENVKDGELLEGWKTASLKEVGKISGGLTKNSKREGFPLKRPFLRVANVYLNRIDLGEVHTIGLKETELERVLLKKNDLLFVEGNGSLEQIGRVAIWSNEIKDCVHQNHLIKVRLSEKLLPKYALYFYCSKRGRDFIKQQASSTSGLHTLSLSKIEGLQIPVPSLSEQNLIIQEIESRLSVADELEETINNSLQQAEALRQSILKKAFEGKL